MAVSLALSSGGGDTCQKLGGFHDLEGAGWVMGGDISGARANLTWSFGSALRGRLHEVGWIGRRIVCQMMKTADYLAVTPPCFLPAHCWRGTLVEKEAANWFILTLSLSSLVRMSIIKE